jgi:hypothetical protein
MLIQSSIMSFQKLFWTALRFTCQNDCISCVCLLLQVFPQFQFDAQTCNFEQTSLNSNTKYIYLSLVVVIELLAAVYVYF